MRDYYDYVTNKNSSHTKIWPLGQLQFSVNVPVKLKHWNRKEMADIMLVIFYMYIQ